MEKVKENRESFFARLKDRLSQADLFDIEDAYGEAKNAHQYDFRKEIDPETGLRVRYFEHPRRATLILLDLVQCYVPNLIIAMLLHDVVEDTWRISPAKIRHKYGREVAELNRLMTKTPENKNTYIEDILLYGDWRVFLLKCVDRFDNLKTLPLNNKEFCERQIHETKEKYFPILDRLVETCPKYLQDGVLRLQTEIKNIVFSYETGSNSQ